MPTKEEIEAVKAATRQAEQEAKELEQKARVAERELRKLENRAKHEEERLQKAALRAMASPAAKEVISQGSQAVAEDVPEREQVRQYCAAITMSLVHRLTAIAYNPFSSSSEQTQAIDKLFKYGIGAPSERMPVLPVNLSSLPYQDAVSRIMDLSQSGALSPAQADHFVSLLQAREASDVQQLRDELAALRELMQGSGRTINDETDRSSRQIN
jgi:hypothetical protein